MGAGELWKAGAVLLTAAMSLLATAIPESLPAHSLSVPQSSQGGLRVGQPFPDFPLPRLDNGEPGSISAFRGKKIILHLFASW